MTAKRRTRLAGQGKAEDADEEFNELAANIYTGNPQVDLPSVGTMKARMVAQTDAMTPDESPECELLYNFIDELYTLVKAHPDDGRMFVECAREAAFMRTARFRDQLYPAA
jgi:hypothetical protein